MSTEVKAHIDELIELLQKIKTAETIPMPGETRHIQTLIGQLKEELKIYHVKENKRPKPGFGKHLVAYIAEDFDAPIEDMKDYM